MASDDILLLSSPTIPVLEKRQEEAELPLALGEDGDEADSGNDELLLEL